jgi:hypothetical protein
MNQLHRVVVSALALSLGAGCRRTAALARAPESARPVPVNELAMLALGEPLAASETQGWEARLASGESTDEQLADALVADPRFATQVAPGLVVRGALGTLRSDLVLGKRPILKRTADAVFYLFDACSAREAVEVIPWWAPQSPVRVCPNAYRPEVWTDPQAKDACDHVEMAWAVRGYEQHGSRDTVCGCGPNLMRCFPDDTLAARAQDELLLEVKETIAEVVRKDQPLAQIFTSRATYRRQTPEHVYRQWRAEAHRLPSVLGEPWPLEGQWADRSEDNPGQHAGILTAPTAVYGEAGLRALLRVAYEELWCVEPQSTMVTTAEFLSLEAKDLRAGGGWEELAHRKVCEECHARLDFGMQFFSQYSDVRKHLHYLPLIGPVTQGDLYGLGIQDLRGRATRSPHGFAVFVTGQPEFGECMTRKVLDHVLGSARTPNETRQVHDAFRAGGTLRPMMRAALLAYARRPQPGPPTPPPLDAPVAALPNCSQRAISPALRTALDGHCSECHTGGDHDLDGRCFPTEALRTMMDRVGRGVMPKRPAELSPQETQNLLALFAQHLGQTPQERESLYAFETEALRAMRVATPEAAIAAARSHAGLAEKETFSLVTPGTNMVNSYRLSPGYALGVGLEMLKLCEHRRGGPLESCLDASMADWTLSR